MVAVAMPEAPSSSSNPLAPSVTDAVATGFSGSVTFMIWRPSSSELATSAYVWSPMVAVAMPEAPSSSSNPLAPSVTLAIAAGEAGFVMLIIWTPSSSELATSAYVWSPDGNSHDITRSFKLDICASVCNCCCRRRTGGVGDVYDLDAVII